MKILAVEFSSEQRSVAIAESSGGTSPVILSAASEKGGRSAHAIGLVQKALTEARLEREAIECIAVGVGPGSYTGIRGAISLAQGWQLATNIKTMAISSVECLAAQVQAQNIHGRVHIVVDAQRNEFYLATYEISPSQRIEVEKLHLAPLSEIEQRAGRGEKIIGSDAARVNGHVMFPSATFLAGLVSTAKSIPAEHLEPIYLRETTFVKAPPPRLI